MKNIGLPVVIGGDNLRSPVAVGLTDLPNIGGPMYPLAPQFGHHCIEQVGTVGSYLQQGKWNARKFETIGLDQMHTLYAK